MALAFSRNLLIALLTTVSVSACGTASKTLDTFDLTTPSPTVNTARKGHVQLLIAEPTALKPLDGENIVVRPAPVSISYLKGAQWGDRLPKIVQSRLSQAFQNTGHLGGVGLPGDGLAIDYQVVSELRAFGIEARGGETAVVEIAVRILNDRNGTVRATKLFLATRPVSGGGNSAYAKALDAAFDEVANDIVIWTLSRI
ncbi:MAG: ABC-type transport auxiliary lipoprotein family protein [Phyllobacterium sp.]